MSEERMKLYVWANPYDVAYGSTMVFAVARTEEEAREQVKRGEGYAHAEYGDDKAPVNMELGQPSRVIEAPCAEWHRWEE